MLRDGAFTVLLLLFTGASAVFVVPPTNVSVSCQNLRVTVSWSSSQQQPQSSFRVDIRGSAWNSEVETRERQCDLTEVIWASEERYMDRLYVTVTAMQGSSQSEGVPSKTFAFNRQKTTNIICELEFPPVDLNGGDSGATVSFRNPFHFYKELRQAVRPDTAFFAFKVTSDGGDFKTDCKVEEETCHRDIPFPEGVEKCVTLTGQLWDGIHVGEVSFKKTDRICAGSSAEVLETLAVVLSVSTVLLIIGVTIIICMVKAWTMKTNEPQPKPLVQRHHGDRKYLTASDPDFNPVTVTASVSSEEEEDDDPTEKLRGGVQPPTGSSMDRGNSERFSQEPEVASLVSEEGQRKDDEDSMKTESVYMEEEEEEEEEGGEAVSPYDSPHALQVDMGDGDMVDAYFAR